MCEKENLRLCSVVLTCKLTQSHTKNRLEKFQQSFKQSNLEKFGQLHAMKVNLPHLVRP